MSVIANVIAIVLLISGLVFFTAGTIGLIRLPDDRTRLHALTKADNLGLGLILAAVAVHVRSVSTTVLLIAVWLLALTAASLSARLLAQFEADDADTAPSTTPSDGKSPR